MWKSKRKTDRNPGLYGHHQSELDNSLIPRLLRRGKVTFPPPTWPGLGNRAEQRVELEQNDMSTCIAGSTL